MRTQKTNQTDPALTVTFPSEFQLKHFEKLYLEFAHTPWEELMERKAFMYQTALMAIIGQNQEIEGRKEEMVAIAHEAISFGKIMTSMYHMTDQEEE